MALSTTVLGLFLILFSQTILLASSAEVRFYAIKDGNDDDSHNASMSTIIRKLISSAKKPKILQNSDEADSQIAIQCQSLHKLFKKYKRQFNSDQSMADEGWHSITSAAYLKVRSPKSARIPLAVKADISRDGHLACDQTDKFKPVADTGDVASQMEIMERKSDDVAGHLVPPKICGPTKWYNLSPMSRSVWSSVADRRGDSWSEAQASLKRWRAEEGGRLELLAVVLYKDLKVPRRVKQLAEGGRRPSGYSFCYRLYDRSNAVRAEAFVTLDNDKVE
ncbi:unnamed protein product, partial [Nesidiocoris tenuis]